MKDEETIAAVTAAESYADVLISAVTSEDIKS